MAAHLTPEYGPPVSPAMFEAKWLKRFNAFLYIIKSYHPGPMHRHNYELHKELLEGVVQFAKEARDLSLKEEDLNMEPLPFERRGSGFLPKQHLNPFEAAERYRELVEDFPKERRNLRNERDCRLIRGWEQITDQDIADVEAIRKGVAKAKADGLWPPDRSEPRLRILSIEDYLGDI